MMDSDTEGHFPELLFMKHTAIKITMAIIRTSAFQAGKKGSDYKHRIVLQAALTHCLSLKISKNPDKLLWHADVLSASCFLLDSSCKC